MYVFYMLRCDSQTLHKLSTIRPTTLTLALAQTHLEHASFHGKHANIEGSASQVEDDNIRSRDSRVLGFLLPVEAVRQGGGGGLVDDTAYVETLRERKDTQKGEDERIMAALTAACESGKHGKSGFFPEMKHAGADTFTVHSTAACFFFFCRKKDMGMTNERRGAVRARGPPY